MAEGDGKNAAYFSNIPRQLELLLRGDLKGSPKIAVKTYHKLSLRIGQFGKFWFKSRLIF